MIEQIGCDDVHQIIVETLWLTDQSGAIHQAQSSFGAEASHVKRCFFSADGPLVSAVL